MLNIFVRSVHVQNYYFFFTGLFACCFMENQNGCMNITLSLFKVKLVQVMDKIINEGNFRLSVET